ncbi:MAG: hypothetical protein K8S25_17515, partial [Alphaproteobacteria bacterium]|nr:hypothetical protein [Alphaproteobacteria bacterium]
MQDDAHYGSANVVLYDAAPANRSSMRAALGAVGFRQIFASSDFEEVARAVTKESCDVLVADLSVEPERICKMMRDVRHGDVSPNPFIVALLTTWGVRAEDANNIMGSGADDVLVRPFSVTFLAERVRALVDARKEFVVTADYVGPNRRKTDDRADHVRLLDVPNTLRLKAKPEEAGGKGIDIASAVREARSKIGEMRLVGSALQLRLL